MSHIEQYRVFSDPDLLAAGLNMHAVLRVADLPVSLLQALRQCEIDTDRFRSLLLIGHGGTTFWRAFHASATAGADPVDAFSASVVRGFLARQWPDRDYCLPYPGKVPLSLQMLGKVAGWHHESPMKVGINDAWGLWYAYRAVVLLEGDLEPSAPVHSRSPCLTCDGKPCVQACAPGALQDAELRLQRCLDFRVGGDSPCAQRCVARLACPVAPEHRYGPQQVEYHYGRSLTHIIAWRASAGG